MLKKIKEHQEHVKEVRSNQEEMLKNKQRNTIQTNHIEQTNKPTGEEQPGGNVEKQINTNEQTKLNKLNKTN